MDNNHLKGRKKRIFQQLQKIEEKLENTLIILERESSEDAIPILFKAVDSLVRLLLSFKQEAAEDYIHNLTTLKDAYKEEGLLSQEALELFGSLYQLKEKYMEDIDFQYEDNLIKNIFEKAEDLLDKSHKFLKRRLLTPKERQRRQKIKKILIITSTAFASGIIIFFLIRMAFNIFGPQHGLLAHYYNNTQLKGPAVVEKIDKKISFKWGNLSPHPRLKNKYSVRWEGRIKIDRNDIYTFYIVSDEGVRLFIDDKLLINTWAKKKRTNEHSAKIKLSPGFHKIKVEYFFNQKYADIKLLWSSNSFKKRPVESRVLLPPLSHPSQPGS